MPAGRARDHSVREARVLIRAATGVAVAAVVGCGLVPPAGDPVPRAHWTGLDCRPIAVAPGPEDIAIDHATGIAYVASTDRFALAGQRRATGPLGHLSALDLTTEAPKPVDVTPAVLRGRVFQPQGIGLHAGAGGKRLFVVNRQPAHDPATGAFDTCRLDNAVEILAIEDAGLRHLETIRDPDRLTRPNDVAPTGARSFYVTNDHGRRSCWGRNLADLLGLNGGHLLAYDGTTFTVAADGLPFANGLAYDGAHERLYVAASQAGAIHVFARDEGDLRPAGPPIRLGSAPDNLTLDADGGLLVAAHPDRWRFLRYARGWLGTERAPAQIIAVGSPASASPEPVEVFRDDGERIAAASVAARYDWQERGLTRLLIGAVFADHVLLCDMEKEGPGEPGPKGIRGGG